jgi:hypothetical protein
MSNTDGSNIDAGVSFNEEPKKQSPKKWKQPHKSDARKAKTAGSYPDYFSWKTRSGHTLQLDDTKGGETVTLQHRSGTAIQMAPDGSMHVTAHHGKYEITFGENRVTISGAQDITVKGDASFRVYGDYNVTCQKDYNLTVLGNFNLTARNHNRQILGNIDTQARNENKKLMGSSAKIARGAIAYVSKGSSTFASQSDQVHIGGAAGINMAVNEGDITSNIEKGGFYSSTKDGSVNVTADGSDGNIRMRTKQGKMEFKSKEDMNHTTESGNYKVTATQGDIGHEAAAGNIEMSATAGGVKTRGLNYSVTATQSAEVTTGTDLDLRSGGRASLHGATTSHVTGATVNVKGDSITNVDGPTALNLNGGISQAMSAISLQIPFDFGSFTDPEEKTGTSRGVHAPDRPAGRSEADNWA